MSVYVADTHAVLWYLIDDRALSAPARAAFRSAVESNDPIFVSTISLVEIIYLCEKGRLADHYAVVGHRCAGRRRESARFAPLDRSVVDALPQILRDQVPDIPDRIIAATALAYGCPLITRDHKIQQADLLYIW